MVLVNFVDVGQRFYRVYRTFLRLKAEVILEFLKTAVLDILSRRDL